ncbi:MAG TPA: chemotaxis-specific protein-glutamate methyltransferase CheB [Mobilitalea sp.]|nr:chemotaxis-specific protein-glutamate methyltransferase CheB [Mobilitalea sp.]
MKNILIIDDSALMRRVLSDIIESDERFQVIDVAINGLNGLNVLQSRVGEVDAVLLDINMPIMNGLELLAELKKQNIKVKVIIVSTIAVKEAKEVILALELGAFDFVTKPESYDGVKSNKFSERILSCLAVATNVRVRTKQRTGEEALEQEVAEAVIIDGSKKHRRLLKKGSKLVAIACSTGGPKALHSVIPSLPENLDAPILIVQHMPQGFTKSLSDRLNELSKIKVKEAEHEEILKKGTVYLAKGGYHLRLHRLEDGQYQIKLAKEASRHGLLPCADIMYESLTDTDFDQITCVVLTGMGGDGTAGIKELNKSKNIYVIAQNEETSIVYGMPKVITESGLVDEIVALQEVSDAIIKNVGVH